MIKILIILIILIIVISIIYSCSNSNSETQKINNSEQENFINITNPFVGGLSQFQLGANKYDQISVMNPNLFNDQSNNVIIPSNKYKYKHKNKSENKSKYNSSNTGIRNYYKEPKIKLNKFFLNTQFNDAYRDVLTAFNIIAPDQKITFNLQSLPVTTTKYDLEKHVAPINVVNMINQFIDKLNYEIKKLPESVEIVNDYNNYLPLTSQLSKYVENKGINKFYKDIGVDYNLYADTPKNAPSFLVKIIAVRREFTDSETKYIATFVIKKDLGQITDQLQITVHFVTKNDPMESYNLYTGHKPTSNINLVNQVAIEFIFIDGYYTNDFDVEYDPAAQDSKNVYNINDTSMYSSYEALDTNNMISQQEIITEFNKKNREHEIEMNNFNINVPYPVYDTPPVGMPQNPFY